MEINPAMENADTLIGAVSVDGVRVKGQYLAAWLPTPLSLYEFWNFVVKKKAKLIVILQCSDPKNPVSMKKKSTRSHHFTEASFHSLAAT